MRWLLVPAVVVVAVSTALNWRAQLQTQQKLDALTAALTERPAVAPAPAPEGGSAPNAPVPAPGVVPRELSNLKLPPYVIEAPDVLLVEAVVKDAKTGTVDRLPDQPVSGQFQVRLDGTVGLGRWGSVSVTGLTMEQAAAAVRAQLAKSSEKLSAKNIAVSVDVVAYNSKRYYVITDTGSGEQVNAFPHTGSETVLDAIANVNGLPDIAGKRSVRIARRTPNAGEAWQMLPVDWVGITQNGVTTTNYQIMPGDRVYVTRKAD